VKLLLWLDLFVLWTLIIASYQETKSSKIFLLFLFILRRVPKADDPNCEMSCVWRYMPYFSYPKAPKNKFRKLYLEEFHSKSCELSTTYLDTKTVFLLMKQHVQKTLHAFVDYQAWLSGDTLHSDQIELRGLRSSVLLRSV